MSVRPAEGVAFGAEAAVLVVGAGAAGLVAALAAREAGADVVVLERDRLPAGSTALSSGMVPAAGTRIQAARGVEDSIERMLADIQAKAHGENDPAIVAAACRAVAEAVDWLRERHDIPFELVEGFLYPGHSRPRMHAPPSRTGAELVGALTRAAERVEIPLLTEALVRDLHADGAGRVRGVGVERPGGAIERIGCGALILACSGFGGDPAMVRRHIPGMAEAMYFGHTGNRGDAVRWGEALDARLDHMAACQGHGSVAVPHGILITWALMMEGGIQVNALGRRFSNEHEGYSEQSARVLAQPGGFAWNIHDARLHRLGLDFEDYRKAVSLGAVREAADLPDLAALTGLPAAALAETLAQVRAFAEGRVRDPFGRDFSSRPPLSPPYFAVRVTGALFHTQGGLVVDGEARVIGRSGAPLPNLFAAGGAACGLSGTGIDGYLSGNGLLSAVAFGYLAGRAAAALGRSGQTANRTYI
ncbi:MAG: FAD-dependent oxidoreductase [Alphaproteobacteria bacterium]|nr:FAD-dependent oxidoreductase [Alphaproteobacteria bacterium]